MGALVFVVACSSGSQQTAAPGVVGALPTQTAASYTGQTTQVPVSITFPGQLALERSARKPSYVPLGTTQAQIVVTPTGGAPLPSTPFPVSTSGPNCSGSPVTCTFSVTAPVGTTDQFTISLMDSAARVLSYGSASQAIQSNTANAVPIVANPVVASVLTSLENPRPLSGRGIGKSMILVTGIDVDGNPIAPVTSAYANPIQVSTSGGAFTLSATSSCPGSSSLTLAGATSRFLYVCYSGAANASDTIAVVPSASAYATAVPTSVPISSVTDYHVYVAVMNTPNPAFVVSFQASNLMPLNNTLLPAPEATTFGFPGYKLRANQLGTQLYTADQCGVPCGWSYIPIANGAFGTALLAGPAAPGAAVPSEITCCDGNGYAYGSIAGGVAATIEQIPGPALFPISIPPYTSIGGISVQHDALALGLGSQQIAVTNPLIDKAFFSFTWPLLPTGAGGPPYNRVIVHGDRVYSVTLNGGAALCVDVFALNAGSPPSTIGTNACSTTAASGNFTTLNDVALSPINNTLYTAMSTNISPFNELDAFSIPTTGPYNVSVLQRTTFAANTIVKSVKADPSGAYIYATVRFPATQDLLYQLNPLTLATQNSAIVPIPVGLFYAKNQVDGLAIAP